MIREQGTGNRGQETEVRAKPQAAVWVPVSCLLFPDLCYDFLPRFLLLNLRGPVMYHRLRLIALFLFACLSAQAAVADVVTLKDGRRFEGTIVGDNDATLSIDTVVSTIRVTLKLDKGGIDTHEKKPVPAGFYDPPPAAPRVSDPTKFEDPGSVYLEAPIRGAFGKDVRASGVRAVLAYARAHRIGHVVFTIDSTGGDLDEAQEIYQLLKSQLGKIRLHAIVHNCLGDALAVPAACDTINLLPGSKIGGLGRRLAEISDKLAKEDEAVLRRQLANDLEATAQERGRSGRIMRAMVDPTSRLAAWRDENNEPALGTALPEGTAKDRVIFEDGPDTVLMLSYEQAIALGLPPFKGDAQDLGKLLGISQWQSESDFGHRTMAKAAADAARQEAGAQAVFAAKVKNNVTRRETAERSMESNMKQASEWAPTKESYATYKNYATHWNWGYGYGGSYDTNRLTAESRKKWRDRTDACMHYLIEARGAMKTMKRLDAEALTLGLKPNYKTGELDQMIDDIEVKVTYLNNHRIRTTE